MNGGADKGVSFFDSLAVLGMPGYGSVDRSPRSNPTIAQSTGSSSRSIGAGVGRLGSLSDSMKVLFEDQLTKFDPSWKARASAGEDVSGAVSQLGASFASSGDVQKIFQEGVLRSQKAGSLIDDLMAGRISAADQASLSTRSAENAMSKGAWGGSVGGAARGLEARDLGLTQHSLQMMGLQQAGHANDALLGAQTAIGSVSAVMDAANKASLAQQLGQAGVAFAQDWFASKLQLGAASSGGGFSSGFTSGGMAGGKSSVKMIGGPITGMYGNPLQSINTRLADWSSPLGDRDYVRYYEEDGTQGLGRL